MAQYRIISELDVGSDTREHRGESLSLDERREVSIVSSASLHEALTQATTSAASVHHGRRIVYAEELCALVEISDEEILRRITEPREELSGRSLIDPADYAGGDSSLYGGDDFTECVAKVAYALRESGIVPGMDLSVLKNEGDSGYAMVEIHDDVRGLYLSQGHEAKHLTNDRSSAGAEGLVQIARALIDVANIIR